MSLCAVHREGNKFVALTDSFSIYKDGYSYAYCHETKYSVSKDKKLLCVASGNGSISHLILLYITQHEFENVSNLFDMNKICMDISKFLHEECGFDQFDDVSIILCTNEGKIYRAHTEINRINIGEHPSEMYDVIGYQCEAYRALVDYGISFRDSFRFLCESNIYSGVVSPIYETSIEIVK